MCIRNSYIYLAITVDVIYFEVSSYVNGDLNRKPIYFGVFSLFFLSRERGGSEVAVCVKAQGVSYNRKEKKIPL